MPVATPPPSASRSRPATPDPLYLLQGEDDVEKSALAARVRRAGRGRAARLQRRAHSRRRHDDRRQAGRRRRVARRRRAHAADDGAAPRRHRRCRPRRCSCRSARARRRRARSSSSRRSSSSPSRRRRWCSSPAPLDKRSRMYKLLPKQATIVECGVLEDQADAERWVRTRVAAAGAADRAGRRAAARRARAAPTSSGCATTSTGCCSTRWARRRSRSTTCGRSPDRRRCRTTGR